VPALMATRVLESRRDRLTTMLVLPLMSCSARFPIYVLFTVAMFPERWHAPVYFGLYLFGAAMALVAARVLRSTILAGESEPLVMELPPYRMPTARGVLLHMWQRGWMYLRKAGTVILGISVAMWALTRFPEPPASALEGLSPAEARQAALVHSIAGRFGRAVEPVTRPLGFDWRINTALVGAFAAKEVFVAQMGIVFSLGEGVEAESESLHAVLRREYTPAQGLAVMVFCLLGFPCMATVAVMWRESGSWRWMALQWGMLTALAYVVALLVYQVGSRLLTAFG